MYTHVNGSQALRAAECFIIIIISVVRGGTPFVI